MTAKQASTKDVSSRRDFFIALSLFILGTIIFIYLVITVISFLGQFMVTPGTSMP